MNIRELEIRLTKLESLKGITEKAEKEYEKEPENEDIEKAFDAAYAEEYNAFLDVVDAVCDMTAGKINPLTVRGIVQHYTTDEIMRTIKTLI